ncbi:hypothetical protein [Halomonas sp. 328]|uniref:hypothetical protein n=1 Tax=Halomonas sp. 328 TaxID=2776704 RepID=UPI0018A77B95|nr:hypothetical protein [Halomonas sp. 328]MBF8223833.1 hypothetical protein [Halomonas sp. 328]
MNCTELSQQADLIASSFSKKDLARLVVALKGKHESLQDALEVIDTIDTRMGYTLDEAWEEVHAGETRMAAVDEE